VAEGRTPATRLASEGEQARVTRVRTSDTDDVSSMSRPTIERPKRDIEPKSDDDKRDRERVERERARYRGQAAGHDS